MSDPIADFEVPRPPSRLWFHAILLLATFVTASISGSWFWEGTLEIGAPWRELLGATRLAQGMPYALLLLAILGAHEMGHYLACRYYRVPATLPFFIPGPPMLIGTFGAVIRIRGPIPSRRALFDIAAAGPIAGFLVALPVLVVGVAHAREAASVPEHGASLGAPLISILFERLFHGTAELEVASTYGAAWVGMLVTSMNLFPVGQLDGGHAIFAISPRAHAIVSWATIAAVGAWVIGQSVWLRVPSAYTLWLVILLVLRARHPRLLEEGEPLGRGRRLVAVGLAVIFILTFIGTPIAFR